jgi:hypothetical protein
MTQELDQLNHVLPVVMGKVDILVIGNEPFIETEASQSGQPLIVFYQQFLLNAYNLFRGTGRLGVADYGMLQSWTKGQQFTAETMPWLLNALFASATVKPSGNGSAFENFPWAEEFTKLQTAR